MKFRPLHDRVVVRRIEEEEKTAGGIIIPDTAKEKPMQGEVIAVGPGLRDESGKKGQHRLGLQVRPRTEKLRDINPRHEILFPICGYFVIILLKCTSNNIGRQCF